MMDPRKEAALAEALRRRKPARFPAVEVEGRMPQPVQVVPVDVPPDFRAQELARTQPIEPQQHEAVAPPQAQAPLAPYRAESEADDAELEAAREADRQSRFAAGMELAGRQLVGGITRTPVPQGLGANPSEVPAAMARAKSKREQAAELLRQQRQGAIDASTIDLQKSQAEKNRREPGDVPMTPFQAESIGLRKTDQQLREEAERRKAEEARAKIERAAAVARARAAAKAKEAGLLAEGANIPFAGGMFKPRSGAKVEKQIAKEASDRASLYNSAITGIDDFMIALGEYAKRPGPETRDAVVAKANGVGGALNTAQGQGAMSEGEKKEMAAALGVDVLSPAGIEAFVQSLVNDQKGEAASTITRRARAVRQSMIEMAKGNLKSKNYDYEAATPATKTVRGVPHEKRADGLWYPVGSK